MTFKELYDMVCESSDITRTSEKEIEYYLDEAFGDNISHLRFSQSENKHIDHPKFDFVKFSFVYKNIMEIRVFSAPGEGASESNSGSITTTLFFFDYPNPKSYYRKETNAFYNTATKKVDYDPVIRSGKNLVSYIKSVLEDDDRNNEYTGPRPIRTSPAKTPKGILV